MSDSIPIGLKTKIIDLPKLRKPIISALAKLNIFTLENLLNYLPSRYLDFSKIINIKDIKADSPITVKAKVTSIGKRLSFPSRKWLCEAVIADDTGSLKVIWFNQPYIVNYLQKGDEVFFAGTPKYYKSLQLFNPIYEKVTEGESIHTGRLVPVYKTTSSLTPRTLRTLIKDYLDLSKDLNDLVPAEIKTKYKLLDEQAAIPEIHFPKDENNLNQAKLKITFNQLLIQQLAVEIHKNELRLNKAVKIKPNIALTKEFLETLPFELTDGQKQAAWQIMQDMEKPTPMHRLLEGDVGSGKTLVAVLAMLQAWQAGQVTVFLAPTEILANQHFVTVLNYCANFLKNSNLKINIALFTSKQHQINNDVITKKELSQKLAKGEVNIIIGTHALLYDQKIKNLVLIIIDEQHRFGVGQRATLAKKSKDFPHLLSMTATPIPRTLALALYGDLDITTLKQIPSGRTPVKTEVVTETGRGKVYDFIRSQLSKGRQAFVITPRVEESEDNPIKSVKQEFERLKLTEFKNFKVGLLYGSMKSNDKNSTMSAFNNKDLDVLVATSVIEIGIDVPNATVIVIEGAENFGLAQLHQLRGRVGRGKELSYCFLFSDSDSESTIKRLEVFAKTNDGFKLAELDLQERGFGSLFGQEQTGFNASFAKFATVEGLKMAQEASKQLIMTDSELKEYPLLKQEVLPLVEQIHLE